MLKRMMYVLLQKSDWNLFLNYSAQQFQRADARNFHNACNIALCITVFITITIVITLKSFHQLGL